MKKLKESVHAIQVGCQICEGPRLDKDCPLNEEVKQVKEEIYSDKTISSSSRQIKTITAYQETYVLNKLHGVSFMSETEGDTLEVLLHQLPPKELNPGSFTLPCTIGKFNFYAITDLDMSKITPLGIVENILVKIDKFLFPSDFVIIDNTPSETTILERPFLATIHAEIDVFAGKFSLGINEERISFDMMRKYHPNDSAIINNPTHRSFDDHKWEFNLEIDKLADEYEIGIWEKGYILDNIWEYCNQVHNDNNGWHNHEFKNEEREEMGIEDEDYHPPEVQVETFKVKNTHLEVDKVLSMFPKT
ncbi:hypothetical protein Tco_0266144 [Tanacetum coccineum]